MNISKKAGRWEAMSFLTSILVMATPACAQSRLSGATSLPPTAVQAATAGHTRAATTSAEVPLPTWKAAIANVQSKGRIAVLVVTSRQVPKSSEFLRRLEGDPVIGDLRRCESLTLAELASEDALDQVARLQIDTFPTILVYSRGPKGIELSGRRAGIVPTGSLIGWLLGLGNASGTKSPPNDPTPSDARISATPPLGQSAMMSDPGVMRAGHDEAYPSPQRPSPPPMPQMAPPAPAYPILPQAAPPTYQYVVSQAPPSPPIPVILNAPPQTLLVQQAPQQAPAPNLLSAPPSQPTYTLAAPPSQPTYTLAAPPSQPTYTLAAPPSQPTYTLAAPPAQPTYVLAAPPSQPTYTLAAPPSQPTYTLAAPPAQPTYVLAAPPAQPTYSLAAPPAQPTYSLAAPAQLATPAVSGLNLTLRAPGPFDRIVGRIGKRLRTHGYPRVAVDLEAAEAAAESTELEITTDARTKHHAPKARRDETTNETEPEPMPPQRHRSPYYATPNQPSPQSPPQ